MNTDIINIVKEQAKLHNVEAEAALAVFDVESSGIAFWSVEGKQLPPIRFEGHYFYARLNDKAQQTLAVAQGLASPIAGRVANPISFAGRYAMLERAKAINEQAALESTSWGLGQVMGANWQSLGYDSVAELVQASMTIAGQVDMVFKYIDANGLTDEINNHDWVGFKNGYNGKKANGYDKKIAAAYDRYKTNKIPDNDEIMQLQKMLNTLGDYKLTQDGVEGNDTKAALRDFQLKNNLVVDGIYGPISKEFIEKAYLAKNNQTTTNVGMSGAGLGTVGTVISDAAKNIQGFADTSQIIQYVFIGMIVLGALISAFGIFRALKK